jgi:hypothetical protein
MTALGHFETKSDAYRCPSIGLILIQELTFWQEIRQLSASPARFPARATPSSPGPQFRGVAETGSAEASYYTWVDQFNTSGLGANTPMATGNANESVMALVDGKWVNMRVPYPLGFFAKYIDGRIDDPNADWKGRALWTTDGNRTPFHRETGKGTSPKVVKFQVRPDPLAH